MAADCDSGIDSSWSDSDCNSNYSPDSDSDSNFAYISDSQYESDPPSETPQKWSLDIIYAIFNNDKVQFLKEVLKDIAPDDLYEMIDQRCFIGFVKGRDIEHRTLNCFKYLVKRGLDINKKRKSSNTVFHTVCMTNLRAIFYTLKNGGDPNIKNDSGDTPIRLYIVQYGKSHNFDVEFIKQAINHGFDVKSINDKGESCLHHYRPRNVEQFMSVLDLFINDGFDINTKDNKGNTFLHNTSIKDSILEQVIPELFSRGFDFRAKNNKDRTAMNCLDCCSINPKQIIQNLEDAANQVKEPGVD